MDAETTKQIRALESKVRRMNVRLVALEAGLAEYGISAEKTVAAYRRRGKTKAIPKRYGLGHDYVADWNRLAERYGWKRIQTITEKRAGALRARENEDAWDWNEIVLALVRCDSKWLADKNWWTFDRLVSGENGRDGETEYVRVLEGAYSSKRSSGGRGRGSYNADSLPEMD